MKQLIALLFILLISCGSNSPKEDYKPATNAEATYKPISASSFTEINISSSMIELTNTSISETWPEESSIMLSPAKPNQIEEQIKLIELDLNLFLDDHLLDSMIKYVKTNESHLFKDDELDLHYQYLEDFEDFGDQTNSYSLSGGQGNLLEDIEDIVNAIKYLEYVNAIIEDTDFDNAMNKRGDIYSNDSILSRTTGSQPCP